MRSRHFPERGAELVEFALVLPLLLAVVAGIVDFGLLFQRYQVLTNAAREGARVRILAGYEDADAQARALAYVQEGLALGTDVPDAWDAAVAMVNLDTDGGGPHAPFAAATVTVTMRNTYLMLGPIMHLLNADPGSFGQVTLTARATMRQEF